MFYGERFNACTHLLGLGVAVAWSGPLLTQAAARNDAASLAGTALFSLAAVLLYASSVAVHSLRGRVRAFWERVDHGAIFLLIGASYTPFALVNPRHGVNIAVLSGLWCLALFLIVNAMRSPWRPDVRFYAAMGWTGVLAALPVALRADAGAASCLLGGAFLYSAGTYFYVNRRGWSHAHGVWHLFVLGGTTLHSVAVIRLLASA